LDENEIVILEKKETKENDY